MNYVAIPTKDWQRLLKQLDRLEGIVDKQRWGSAKETGKTRAQLQYIRERHPELYRVSKGVGKYEYLIADPVVS